MTYLVSRLGSFSERERITEQIYGRVPKWAGTSGAAIPHVALAA
jgi:hypothetical protein